MTAHRDGSPYFFTAGFWESAPMELRVAFDRPIDESVTREPARVQIEFGEHVSAADRLETLKPPYKIVKAQATSPRGKLRVVSARLSPDARMLVLTTDPHAQSVRYALELPGIKGKDARPRTVGPPVPIYNAGATVDLDYDLSGVKATWTASGAAESWKGWLPHLDSDVNAALTAHSAEHEIFTSGCDTKAVCSFARNSRCPARTPRSR